MMNCTQRQMSSGSPIRPTGICEISVSRAAWFIPRVIGVSMKPGLIAKADEFFSSFSDGSILLSQFVSFPQVLAFSAVVAIFVVLPRAQRLLEGYPVPKLAGEAVAVSVACGLATAPVLWLQFGRIPLYSVPANALAAPVVGPLLGLSFAAAVVDPISPGAAVVIASANGWLAAYVGWCARLVGGLPGAVVSSTAGLAALLLAASLLLLLLAGGRDRSLRRP